MGSAQLRAKFFQQLEMREQLVLNLLAQFVVFCFEFLMKLNPPNPLTQYVLRIICCKEHCSFQLLMQNAPSLRQDEAVQESPMNMAEGNSFFRAKYTLNAANRRRLPRSRAIRPQIILSKRSE
jgi:hypothetical protein